MINVLFFLPDKNKSIIEFIHNLPKDEDLFFDVAFSIEEVKIKDKDVLITFAHDFDKLTGVHFEKTAIIFLRCNRHSLSYVYKEALKHDVSTILEKTDFPIIPKVVKKVYSQLLSKLKTKTQKAHSILITSFKGGAGKSFVGFNLFYHLSRLSSANNPLYVDISLPFGSLKPLADLSAKVSWHTIRPLLQNVNDLTIDRLNGIIVEKNKLNFLTCPQDYSVQKPLNYVEMVNLLGVAKRYFDIVFIDFPTIFNENIFKATTAVDTILIVFSLDPQSINALYNGLNSINISNDNIKNKIKFIVNFFDSSQLEILSELKKRIDLDIIGVVEEDYEAATVFTQKASFIKQSNLVLTKNFTDISEAILKSFK